MKPLDLPDIPLPPQWSSFTKRALQATFSLSFFCLTALCAHGHSVLAPGLRELLDRLRLQARLACHEQIVGLLQARLLRCRHASRARSELPRYTAAERRQILQIKDSLGWSAARTARTFLVCAATITKWQRQFDDDSLVAPPEPVNKFPDFVGVVVRQLKAAFPFLGSRQIASWLAKASLQISATTARKVLAIRTFEKEPKAAEVVSVLEDAVAALGVHPRHLVVDKGCQFFDSIRGKPTRALQQFLDDHRMRVRFGAVGRKGSIAIIERFWRTLKGEGLRRTLIPYSRGKMQETVVAFVDWYNQLRPHSALHGESPDDVFSGDFPPQKTRWETRRRYPIPDPVSALGQTKRARSAELRVSGFRRQEHLPVVDIEFNEAA